MATEDRLIEEWTARASRARREAHSILEGHEAAASRVLSLGPLLDRLAILPVDIQDYFFEAARCLQVGARRAAVVLAWSGFLHTLVEVMVRDHEATLRTVRKKWKFKDTDDLKEGVPEAHLVEAAKAVGLIGKNDLRMFQGQLATRNQCAHPTLYSPSVNIALGFVDQVAQQTIQLAERPKTKAGGR